MLAVGIRYGLQRTDDRLVEMSGRIEGYEVDLGAKVGGRLTEITVREGDSVKPDQVVARLDDGELQAQFNTATAGVTAAQEQVNQAQLQLRVLDSQMLESTLTVEQSQGDAIGRVSQASALVAAAQAALILSQAQLQEAQAAAQLAQTDRDRLAALLAEGAVAQQQFDQAQTQWQTAQETVKARRAAVGAAQEQVRAAQGALTQSQTNRLNPEIRRVQLERIGIQKEQAVANLAAATANLDRAKSTREEVASRLADLTIKSPLGGVVVTRTAEPGEVITPGTIVLTVVNLAEVYLRGYIPEGEVGAIQIGQPAEVFLDSAPDRPLKAIVAAVDAEASFTPENIYFKNDRVSQVFGVKLALENPEGFAKPGMPADARLVRGDQ
jgi:HlyD family secretion protein